MTPNEELAWLRETNADLMERNRVLVSTVRTYRLEAQQLEDAWTAANRELEDLHVENERLREENEEMRQQRDNVIAIAHAMLGALQGPTLPTTERASSEETSQLESASGDEPC